MYNIIIMCKFQCEVYTESVLFQLLGDSVSAVMKKSPSLKYAANE